MSLNHVLPSAGIWQLTISALSTARREIEISGFHFHRLNRSRFSPSDCTEDASESRREFLSKKHSRGQFNCARRSSSISAARRSVDEPFGRSGSFSSLSFVLETSFQHETFIHCVEQPESSIELLANSIQMSLLRGGGFCPRQLHTNITLL